MKFAKLLKMAAGSGVVIERDGGKWLMSETVVMKIPNEMNVVAAFRMQDPTFCKEVFDHFGAEGYSTAELTGAELPIPEMSASKIIRIFTDAEGGKIAISNKHFGLIEKGDECLTIYGDGSYTDTAGNEQPIAMAIIEGWGEDAEIKGVIFADDYYHRMLKKEV